MKFLNKTVILTGICATIGLVGDASADSVEARCDIYPAGEDQASAMIACTFSQYQGNVYIDRSDGVKHELEATGDQPGNFSDADGRAVYRQTGLGDQGLIFRFPEESIFVYWDASSLSALKQEDAATSPTAPYTTAEYDATTLLSCSLNEPLNSKSCPAGILRGDPGSASVRIMKLDGEERVLNFNGDRLSTPHGGDLNWKIQDGDWHINIDGREFYFVPEAVIFGG